MPAIYIQLAGERTHFTSPSTVSLKLTRAFQVRLQLAVATVPLLHVQRATVAATCVLICSERFALMPKNARVGQGVLQKEQEQQETWLPRGHMMQH